MEICRTMLLFGNAQSIELARIWIENHPQARRVDMITIGRIHLSMRCDIEESEWITELKTCGIHGFCIL